MMRLLRGHGLGNDYLILLEGPPLSPELARAVCDRHTGVGSDGILEPALPVGTDYGVRIWNPDGSIAEKSGNGLRIYARWLRTLGGAPKHFTIWTGHDSVRCACEPDAITIDMGRVSTANAHLELADTGLDVVLVDVGNPHCVVFRDEDDLDALPWRTWGPALENHPHFVDRTNVQFARVVKPQHLEARIWERGAGETQASGSSSCAIAAAAVATSRASEGPIAVHMPGGTLEVAIREGRALLRGPAQLIGTFTVLDSYYPSLGIPQDTRKPT